MTLESHFAALPERLARKRKHLPWKDFTCFLVSDFFFEESNICVVNHWRFLKTVSTTSTFILSIVFFCEYPGSKIKISWRAWPENQLAEFLHTQKTTLQYTRCKRWGFWSFSGEQDEVHYKRYSKTLCGMKINLMEFCTNCFIIPYFKFGRPQKQISVKWFCFFNSGHVLCSMPSKLQTLFSSKEAFCSTRVVINAFSSFVFFAPQNLSMLREEIASDSDIFSVQIKTLDWFTGTLL